MSNRRSYFDQLRVDKPVVVERMEFDMLAADLLKQEMQITGLTQNQLGVRAGMTRQAVNQSLSGIRGCSIMTLVKLAFHMGKRWEITLVDLD